MHFHSPKQMTEEKKFKCPRCKRPHVLTIDSSNEQMLKLAHGTMCYRCADASPSDHPINCDPCNLEIPRDPLAPSVTADFQFPIETLDAVDFAALSSALGEVIRWLLSGSSDSAGRKQGILLRLLALAWVLRPDYFGGEGVSAAEVCRQFDLPKNRFSEHCAEFTRRYGVRNRAQAHGWNRKQANQNNALN